MLELGLHFSGLMNWVSGLRFSIPIPYWAILLSLTPPSFLFQVRPMSRSNYTGSVLLGFYYYWALGFYHFYRFIAFALLSIVYVISYFGLSVYVVLYVSDFILYYGIQAWMWTFKYLYMDISDICTYRIIFTISKVTGVTFWYQSYLLIVTFYYVNRGVTFWYQSGFRPGSDPGWRFWRPWFIRFKRF